MSKKFYFECVLLFSLALSFLLGYFQYDEPQVIWSHWLAFFSVWMAIISAAIYVSKDPFSPVWIVIAYLLVYFFIRPSYVLISGSSDFLFEISRISIRPYFFFLSSLFLFIIGSSFLIGYQFSGNFARFIAGGYTPRFSLGIDKGLLYWSAMLIIALATGAFIYVVNQLGGIGEILAKQAAIVKLIPDLGFSVKLAWIVFNLYSLGVILFLVAKGPTKFLYFLMVLGIVMCLIVGRRTPLLAMIIPLVIYRHHYINRITIKKAVGLAFILFTIFIAIVAYRIFTTANVLEKSVTTIFASAEYFVWDMNMAILTDFNNSQSYRWGMDFLPYWFREEFNIDKYFTTFSSVGEATVDMYFSGFPAGIPSGMPGTLFMNFGWLGVFFGMLIWGVLARVFYEYMALNKDNKLVTLLIFPVGLLALFYVLRLGDFWLGFSTQIRFIAMAILLALTASHFRLFWRKRRHYV